MQFLSNREIAFLSWGSVLLIWVFITPDIRKSAFEVIKIFFSRPILISLAIMASYIGLLIYLLNSIGIYDNSQLKDTLVWSISVGVVSLMKINTISNDRNYFKDTIRDNLITLIGIEFLLSYYTFNLVIELLIISFAVLVGGMQVIAERDEKFKLVGKNLNRIIVVLGFIEIIHAVYKLVTGFDEFIASGALKGIYYPVLLTLLYIPFIYCFTLYIDYVIVFRTMQFIIKVKKLLKYAGKKAMHDYKFNKEQLKRWRYSLNHFSIETKDDVNSSFTRINEAINFEKNASQLPILLKDGWNPIIAKDFLKEHGLISGYYNPCGNDEWYSCTPYFEIGDSIIPNNLAFYTEGSKEKVKILKLVLNVNNPEQLEDTLDFFIAVSETLLSQALSKDLPDTIKKAIMTGNNRKEYPEENIVVEFIKDVWSSRKGYSYKFVIENTFES